MAEILFSALSARRGGGLTYIRNIVRAFPRNAGSRLTVLSPTPLEGLPAHPNVEWEQAPAWTSRPIPRVLFGAIYFRYLWPRRRDFDAVYYAGGSFDIAVPNGVKRIVAFRNMLPFDREQRRRYPLGWTRFRHWLLEFVQGSAMRRADLVIFISDYARQVIDKAVRPRHGASVVIPHGATPTAAPLDPLLVAQLPGRFVLYLSQLEVYKGQVELVEAWALLRRQRPTSEKLVLAGPELQPYAQRVRDTIRRLGLEHEVILTGAIRHDQVSDLAKRATLNVFLSSCENCPNVLLELLLIGRPLLVSNKQPMPELGGPRLDYVDPDDPPAIASAIARLLGDPQHSAAVADAAAQRSGLYTWERAGNATWNAILRCAGDSSQRSSAEDSNRQVRHV
jgi:glycosyltransferase involved in cell wall biosynthesis